MTNSTNPATLSKSKAVMILGSAGAMYGSLEKLREPYLTQAQANARLTLPYLCPPSEGAKNASTVKQKETLYRPRNEVGSEGVKNLASKILLALWPANIPFLKFAINEALLDEADQIEEEVGGGEQIDEATGMPIQAGGSFRSEIQKQLLAMEKVITSRTDRKAHRKVLFEIIKKLIVTGNVLMRWNEDGTIRSHNLGTYVVERDYYGNPYRIILKELIQINLLDDDTRAKVLSAQPDLADKPDASTELFTYWGAQDSSELWETWQEVTPNGVMVPDSYGTYKKENLPVSAQRWVMVDGEDYGISLIEEHYESLADLEQLNIDVSAVSKACARIIPMAHPQGLTDVSDINDAENLEFIQGREEDITILTLLDKVNDYSASNSKIDRLNAHLQRVFLMFQSAQRDAERVTAEEVRYIANQLEQAHGGVYTVLADELQKPYVEQMITQALKEGDLEKTLFADGDIKPEVITGLDAIGRGQDVEALDEIIMLLAQDPEAKQEFNMRELWSRRLIARGIELDGILKTPQSKIDEANRNSTANQNALADGVEADMAVESHKAQLAAPPPTV